MLPINVAPDVCPSSPKDVQPAIGLIGMGAMGKMYAKYLAEAGWQKCVFGSLNSTRCQPWLAESMSAISLNASRP